MVEIVHDSVARALYNMVEIIRSTAISGDTHQNLHTPFDTMTPGDFLPTVVANQASLVENVSSEHEAFRQLHVQPHRSHSAPPPLPTPGQVPLPKEELLELSLPTGPMECELVRHNLSTDGWM